MQQPQETRVGNFPYRRRDHAALITCRACGRRNEVRLPLVVDWRDRSGLAVLFDVFPTNRCPSCGVSNPTAAPVVMLRPGDAIPVVFCFPQNARGHLEAFESALAEHATDDAGVIPGPIAQTSAELLEVIADRYTGFAVTDVPCPDQEWASPAAEWIASMRASHEWPDVVGAVNRFVSAADEDAAFDVFTIEACLQQAAWDPVVRRLGVLLVEAQEDPSAAAAVSRRIRRLAGFRMTGTQFDSSTPEAQRTTALLSEMLQLQASPNRTSQDITTAIAIGRQLIEHARRTFGDHHPIVLTAMNDTAAMLLDDAVDPEGVRAGRTSSAAAATCSRRIPRPTHTR